MPIETKCTTCGKTLRVGDEHAGSQARCPACSTVFVVPGGAALAAAEPAVVPVERWSMKTPEGQIYGPIAKPELDRWLSEGRIAADCELRCGDDAPWRPADACYSVLKTRARSPLTNPFTDIQVAEVVAPAANRLYLVPHRGGMILALGIIAWVFTCPIFSIVAWMLGASDLREMREGRMESSGMGLTQAGHILGLIYSLLWLALVVIGLFIFVLRLALG